MGPLGFGVTLTPAHLSITHGESRFRTILFRVERQAEKRECQFLLSLLFGLTRSVVKPVSTGFCDCFGISCSCFGSFVCAQSLAIYTKQIIALSDLICQQF